MGQRRRHQYNIVLNHGAKEATLIQYSLESWGKGGYINTSLESWGKGGYINKYSLESWGKGGYINTI